jgi:hypothetical protein
MQGVAFFKAMQVRELEKEGLGLDDILALLQRGTCLTCSYEDVFLPNLYYLRWVVVAASAEDREQVSGQAWQQHGDFVYWAADQHGCSQPVSCEAGFGAHGGQAAYLALRSPCAILPVKLRVLVC